MPLGLNRLIRWYWQLSCIVKWFTVSQNLVIVLFLSWNKRKYIKAVLYITVTFRLQVNSKHSLSRPQSTDLLLFRLCLHFSDSSSGCFVSFVFVWADTVIYKEWEHAAPFHFIYDGNIQVFYQDIFNSVSIFCYKDQIWLFLNKNEEKHLPPQTTIAAVTWA